MKLCIGVVDVPEPLSDATTYEVASILEKEYGLFSEFWEKESAKAADYIAQELLAVMENYQTFGNLPSVPFEETANKMAEDFRSMIDNQEFNNLPGVPTMAAQLGINRRLKNGNKRRGKKPIIEGGVSARPSFQDTGTMEKSIKVWFET